MLSRQPQLSNKSSSRRARSFDVLKMLRASAPVAIALMGSFWIGGCDTPANQDDRKVQADVAQAQAAIAIGGPSSAAAMKTLEQAAADSAPGPLTRAYTKNALAQAEQNQASLTMQKIDQDDATLRRLIWEISQLAQQIDASRVVASSYDKYDPKPAKDAIAADIAAAQGGPAQPNQVGPNLAAVKQTISQLQGQIAKQTDDLKNLQDQRTQVLDEADQADKSSEITKGQESVDDFKRAADLRKQAGDLSVQIEKNQAQTVPMQKDLEVAQGQQTVLEELIQQLQEQSAALDAGWKSVQDAVGSQAVLQKQIAVGTGDATAAPAAQPAPAPTDASGAPGAEPGASATASPTEGPSLNDKAEALGKLVQQILQERNDAISDLNNAIDHYRAAASAAGEYFAILDPKITDPANAQRPELNGWKTLQAIAHPAVYQMHEALAQRQLADLYLSQIDNDNQRAALQDQVSKILGQVNIPVAPALADAGIDDDKKNAADSAAAAYKVAEERITNLTKGSAPAPLPKLAKVQLILTRYGQVQLARATGDTSTADSKLSDTKDALNDALQAGLPLPPLPPEITPPPAPATPTTPPT